MTAVTKLARDGFASKCSITYTHTILNLFSETISLDVASGIDYDFLWSAKRQIFWFRRSVWLDTVSAKTMCKLQRNIFSQMYQQNLPLPLMRGARCMRHFTIIVSFS